MNVNKILHILNEECNLRPGARILAGVSGGPDSLCLMDILDKLDYAVCIAHLDHSLRPESGDEACLVKKMAQRRDLEFVTARADVKTLAREENRSLEEAARVARYRFLFDQAHRYRAEAVVVAHTADDQVETVLMHLLRGSGLGGLKGMTYISNPLEWGSEIPLLRPLLGVWRSEILAYCQEHQLKPIFDASNLDTTYFRNRLRYELLPYLENYNPQIKNILWRTSQSLGGDFIAIQQLVDQAWEKCLRDEKDGCIQLSFDLKDQPKEMQRNLLRRAMVHLRPGLRDFDFESVERGLAFVKNPSVDRQIDLMNGLVLAADYSTFYIAEHDTAPSLSLIPTMAVNENLALPLFGQVLLDNGWAINCRVEDINYESVLKKADNASEVYMDADQLIFPLNIHTCHQGERIELLGMEGRSMKLSDFWINNRLPRRAREKYPLVYSEEKIAWIPGFRLAHFCRVKPCTKRVVRLSLVQPDR